MSIERSCNPGDLAVELDLSLGHRLHYAVTPDDSGPVFTLTDQDNVVLLSDEGCEEGCEREWPGADEVPAADDVTHVFAIEFGQAGGCEYEVQVRDDDGATVRSVKSCRYTNDGGTDEFFEDLRIFITGRP